MTAQYRPEKKRPWIVQRRIKVVDQNGVIQSKVATASFYTEGEALEYELIENKKKNAVQHGLKMPASKTLLIDHAKDFLRRRVKNPEIAFSTFQGDERRIRKYWLPKLGAMPLEMIRSQDILSHLDHIQFELGKSPAERNRIRSVLSVLLEDAKLRGKIEINPAGAVAHIKEKPAKKRIHLKEDEDFEKYLKALLQEGFQYWVIGNILGFTGARICMANVIQHQDIDLKKNLVLFRRIEERAGGSKIVERIKGKIAIDDEQDIHVVPLLPRLREVYEQVLKVSPFRKPKDFVAWNINGSYVPYDTWKDVHKRAVARAEIADITSHAIRRYFATSLKKAGFTRSEIREMGGWSSDAVVGRYDLRDVDHLAKKARELGFGEIDADNIVKFPKKGVR